MLNKNNRNNIGRLFPGHMLPSFPTHQKPGWRDRELPDIQRWVQSSSESLHSTESSSRLSVNGIPQIPQAVSDMPATQPPWLTHQILSSDVSLLLQTLGDKPYVCHIFLIQSFVDGHLGCFHVLAIVNSAAMNTGVHVSFQISVFVFSGYMPRSGIAGSHGRVVSSDLTGACCVFLACQDGTWSEAPDSSFCFLLPKF